MACIYSHRVRQIMSGSIPNMQVTENTIVEQSQRCWLCQQKLGSSKSSRMQGFDTMREFVKDLCQPTPFWYQWLVNVCVPVNLCIACVNWKRRCSTGAQVRSRSVVGKYVKIGSKRATVKKYEKPMLQLDQLILFLMYPGRFTPPDQRCLHRLLESLMDPGNMVWHVVPMCVKGVLAQVDGTCGVQDLVKAWWVFNGRTPFLKNPILGRMVRAAIKGDNTMDVDVDVDVDVDDNDTDTESEEEEEEETLMRDFQEYVQARRPDVVDEMGKSGVNMEVHVHLVAAI
jgi:hypothetical protein